MGLVTDEVEEAFTKAVASGAAVKKPERKLWGQLVGYVRDSNGFICRNLLPCPSITILVSSQQSTVDFIVEQMAGAGAVSGRKMFGEYAIFCNGKMIALICDDQLLVKPTSRGRAHIGEVTEAPPYKGAKPCLVISGDSRDDREWMSTLAQISTAELPTPVKKHRAK